MTTTFADIKLTETVENYMYENKEYNFEQGDVVSLPKHTANRFVNKWGYAKYEKAPYEVLDEEYEAVVGRIRNKGEDELSYNELQDVAKENDVPANQSREDIEAALDEKGVDY